MIVGSGYRSEWSVRYITVWFEVLATGLSGLLGILLYDSRFWLPV